MWWYNSSIPTCRREEVILSSSVEDRELGHLSKDPSYSHIGYYKVLICDFKVLGEGTVTIAS